jgi:Zn finger protein HypA/HybF involved in hydrogenase expression
VRKFKCSDCKYTWDVIFFEEKPGVKQACPKCKSLNVQRMNKKDMYIDKTRESTAGNKGERLKNGYPWS